MWSWFFRNLMKFTAGIFSSSSDTSSKRVNGTLCILTVLLIVIISTSFGLSISKELLSLIKMIFWGGAGLLGLGMADKYLK